MNTEPECHEFPSWYKQERTMNIDPRSDKELNRVIDEWMGEDGVLPNFYCTDRNTISEAVKKLNHNQMASYCNLIADVSDKEGVCWTTRTFAMIEASARQRAEALVKVIEEERK